MGPFVSVPARDLGMVHVHSTDRTEDKNMTVYSLLSSALFLSSLCFIGCAPSFNYFCGLFCLRLSGLLLSLFLLLTPNTVRKQIIATSPSTSQNRIRRRSASKDPIAAQQFTPPARRSDGASAAGVWRPRAKLHSPAAPLRRSLPQQLRIPPVVWCGVSSRGERLVCSACVSARLGD